MKSNVAFLVGAYEALMTDCGLPVKDKQTIIRRLQNEGLTFVTEVLPRFSREILGSIECGVWTISRDFSHLSTTVLPCFMQSYTRCIFGDDGKLLPPCRESAQSLYIIRQICEYAYKADFGASDNKDQAVLDSFLATEQELRTTPISGDPRVTVLAHEIIRAALNGFSPDLSGAFGPGVCSDASPSEKYSVNRVDSPATREYKDSYYMNFEHSCQPASAIRMTNHSVFDGELYGRVILVPKDSRGPRLICAEPSTNQWLQMSLMRSLVNHVEQSEWTAGFVNFTSQEVNQELVKVNSVNKTMCTIDLKDASDRVRLDLVQFLFNGTSLLKPLMACRTPRVQMPNGDFLKLSKFAPMGSAMCFPTLALTIWSLACAAISLKSGTLVTDCVYVYGDDLICPSYLYDIVVEALEGHGLRVNTQKSYHRSHFRESCGVDYYYGLDVSPTRLRKPPTKEACVRENAFRLVTHSNECEVLPCLQEYLRSYAEDILAKPIAYSSAPIPGTFRVGNYDERLRLNKKGRYRINCNPVEGVYLDTEYSVFNRALRRIGADTQSDVSSIDLRRKEFSLKRLRSDEWRAS